MLSLILERVFEQTRKIAAEYLFLPRLRATMPDDRIMRKLATMLGSHSTFEDDDPLDKVKTGKSAN